MVGFCCCCCCIICFIDFNIQHDNNTQYKLLYINITIKNKTKQIYVYTNKREKINKTKQQNKNALELLVSPPRGERIYSKKKK